jgi:alkanesulfonate monooxygenase SsuD/methylene tetrahydromethanopterin reductase-like flavin-dependent oxidoreductase (luciferase family)
MQFGFSPNQSQDTFDIMLGQSALAEEMGFHTIWAHEHHSQGALYPSPILALAAVAGVTKRVQLGTNMVILPLYHPLRVAEDFAMLSLMCGGRAVLGASVGYVEKEFRAIGVSLKDRASRMEQGLSVIKRLWSGEAVTAKHDGMELEEHVLFPLPPSPPPIYIGGLVPRAVRRAARLGDGFLLSAGTTRDQASERIRLYRNELEEEEEEEEEEAKLPIAINRIVQVVPNKAEKERVLDLVGTNYLNLYDNWGHQDVTSLTDRQRLLVETSNSHFILGEPEECVEKIKAYQEIGIGHIACLMNFGNPPVEMVERSMKLFADKVMPAF